MLSLLAALALLGMFLLLKRVTDVESEMHQLAANMNENTNRGHARRFRSGSSPCTGLTVPVCMEKVWNYIFKVEAERNLTEQDFETVARDTHRGILQLMASISDAEAHIDRVDSTQSSQIQDVRAHIGTMEASIADGRDKIMRLRQPSYQPSPAEFDCSGTGAYTLPASVPQSATVVLVGVYMRSGNNVGQEGDFRMDMWTSQGARDDTQSTWGHHYGQNAWSFNSGNFEFAVNGNFGRVIHHRTSVFGGSLNSYTCTARLYGYRV